MTTPVPDTKQALQLALKQNTPRIERAIQELARSFVTVDICGSDANEVATYVHQLEAEVGHEGDLDAEQLGRRHGVRVVEKIQVRWARVSRRSRRSRRRPPPATAP